MMSITIAPFTPLAPAISAGVVRLILVMVTSFTTASVASRVVVTSILVSMGPLPAIVVLVVDLVLFLDVLLLLLLFVVHKVVKEAGGVLKVVQDLEHHLAFLVGHLLCVT